MREQNLWKVRRNPHNTRQYQVCMYEQGTGFGKRVKDIIPGFFDNLKSAQEFAEAINAMKRGVKGV